MMTKEERFLLIQDIIKAINQGNLHTKPSEETLRLISKLQTKDEVFGEKIDNFILESGNDQKKIYEKVKEVKEELKLMNGSVNGVLLWRERVRGQIDMLKILFLPIILAIIYLYLDKFF